MFRVGTTHLSFVSCDTAISQILVTKRLFVSASVIALYLRQVCCRLNAGRVSNSELWYGGVDILLKRIPGPCNECQHSFQRPPALGIPSPERDLSAILSASWFCLPLEIR